MCGAAVLRGTASSPRAPGSASTTAPKSSRTVFRGAGTHPGAGVPGVLSSAKVVENLLRESVAPQAASSRAAGRGSLRNG